uniref:SWIM-type domain-containing protein n=1 Tax=Trichogramma kaykai TaxID=54128 RepID=A0ABD2X6E3_9HYME
MLVMSKAGNHDDRASSSRELLSRRLRFTRTVCIRHFQFRFLYTFITERRRLRNAGAECGASTECNNGTAEKPLCLHTLLLLLLYASAKNTRHLHVPACCSVYTSICLTRIRVRHSTETRWKNRKNVDRCEGCILFRTYSFIRMRGTRLYGCSCCCCWRRRRRNARLTLIKILLLSVTLHKDTQHCSYNYFLKNKNEHAFHWYTTKNIHYSFSCLFWPPKSSGKC